jgi:hypothetical protein
MLTLDELKAQVREILGGGLPIGEYTPGLPQRGEVGRYEITFWESRCLKDPELVRRLEQAGWSHERERRPNGTWYWRFEHYYRVPTA